MNWADENVPAILEAWYPGQAAGSAIANGAPVASVGVAVDLVPLVHRFDVDAADALVPALQQRRDTAQPVILPL